MPPPEKRPPEGGGPGLGGGGSRTARRGGSGASGGGGPGAVSRLTSRLTFSRFSTPLPTHFFAPDDPPEGGSDT